ncbi:hypothetical protein C8F04DRAFT_1257388 [Mycena alexandri]|uniref:Uncharacterized protein n=1 Tax=Mycena alexandri TaxID=1745969 RepID=A0AAD6X6W6_9AGAR|nr:hypothetical protein C8F04DRAFT_1257388 [Mycena alexandri]
MALGDDKRSGVSGGVTAVTSTVGNGVGGVLGTVGGVVGAAGRGGETVTGVTGSYGKPAGDALYSLGDGLEGGTRKIARGVEDAGKGKRTW